MELPDIQTFGKFAQLKKLDNFSISDEQLEEFLIINFKHIGLSRGKNQDEDVHLISWYTKKKFIIAIQIFSKLGVININNASIIPYIFNIVNENSQKISLQPNFFKGKLYPPQASLIKRMLEIEMSPLELMLSEKPYKYHCGIVNERLSFGKTFCLPALICERIIPYIKSEQNQVPTNLIICGTKVAKNYKDNLKNFTTLNFHVIETMNQLTSLEMVLKENKYPDVVVVKDGDITWKNKKTKALDHVQNLFENKIFARIIYDDYDMLKIKYESSVPEALFTWFVSGTDGVRTTSNISIINEAKTISKLSSLKIILDTIATVQCNREYSIVEFNIPKIDNFCTFLSPFKLVQNILNNKKEPFAIVEKEYIDPSLFCGTINIPYVYNKENMKILVTINDKNSQIEFINSLNNLNIKTVKLTRANINKFEREDIKVGVCGNLFGVNMGFLTHIIINNDFTSSEMTQMIGRGQRLARKQNLQVYFCDINDKFNSASDEEC